MLLGRVVWVVAVSVIFTLLGRVVWVGVVGFFPTLGQGLLGGVGDCFSAL